VPPPAVSRGTQGGGAALAAHRQIMPPTSPSRTQLGLWPWLYSQAAR
jgi:hypothetical protein